MLEALMQNTYIVILSFITLAGLLFIFVRRPKQVRNWCPEHKIQAVLKLNADKVSITDLVEALYLNSWTAKVKRVNWKFKIDDIKHICLLLELFEVKSPLGKTIRPIHTFFGIILKDNRAFAVSPAGRRLLNEDVTFARILPHYKELHYKIIRLEDTLHARAVLKKNDLYCIPLNLSKEQIKKIIVSIATETQSLKNKAQWFDTFTRNCVMETLKHLRKAGLKIPYYSFKYSTTTNLEKVFLGTILPFSSIKEMHEKTKINHLITDDKKFIPELSRWIDNFKKTM